MTEPLRVAPDADRRPILQEGRYGEKGEATLHRIVARAYPTQKKDGTPTRNAGQHYISFNCSVDDPTAGRVFVDVDSYSSFHTNMTSASGSMAPLFLAGVGLSIDTVAFSPQADEKGNHALLGANPCGETGCKVVIDVGLREYETKEGDKRQTNFLKAINLLR